MLASYRRTRKLTSESPAQEDSRPPCLAHRKIDDRNVVVRHAPSTQMLDFAASYIPSTPTSSPPDETIQTIVLPPNTTLPNLYSEPLPKLVPVTTSEVKRYHRRVLLRNAKKNRSKSKEKGNRGAVNQSKQGNFQAGKEKAGRNRTTNTDEAEDEDGESNWDLPPGTQDYSAKEHDGWTACIHPEGALYFFHSASRIYTDFDMRQPQAAETVQLCMKALQVELDKEDITLSASTDIMMDIVPKVGKQWRCEYYLVNHDKRCIFWVHPMNTKHLVGHVQGITRVPQLRFAMETQYWQHVEYFPHKQNLGEKIYKELSDIVVHANAEAITSSTYLAPFDKEELSKMLDLMSALNDGREDDRPYFTCVIARLMRLFANIKFYNFCGQPGARLDADQSVYAKSKSDSKTTLLKIMNPILFGAPEVHINDLQKVYVDDTVNHARWTDFTNNLYNEWNGFTIYSTVMLAVDVSFLAVPGVDPGNSQEQTLATIAIYLSTMNAVGSLVISLLLAGQSRTRGRESMENAATFMSRMTKTRLRTESLGIMYSLPYALLMWGMVWFIISLSYTIACMGLQGGWLA
ncbi:hypothetical protein BJ138DRAFT_362852 [Hygrophoropsis aurantiaca]|uniref:Uncharacterized protein n=1 Tax=Hygrophoropsis aurantiaca TaxID=72124 RepID=A0ACB8ANE9_9AGAM|nr:hypothetical protein BJ138DRAFT_362852 [Hygrophoropsis aurantiaca]